jgi:hypothetical protein
MLPPPAPGSPFTAIEFEGLMVTPYVDASRDQRQMAAVGCIWLRSVTSLRRQTGGHKPRSKPVYRGRSGGRGIRTHGDVAATMVFKTIAIGH